MKFDPEVLNLLLSVHSAVKIVVERVLQNDMTWRLMLRDISGSDIEQRNKSLTCLRFVLPFCKNISYY